MSIDNDLYFFKNVLFYANFDVKEANDFDGKIAFYESILKDLVDVVQIVRDELKLDQVIFQKSLISLI